MSVPGEDYSSNTVVMVMMSTRYNKDLWASDLRQGVLLTDAMTYCCVHICGCRHVNMRHVSFYMLIHSDPV